MNSDPADTNRVAGHEQRSLLQIAADIVVEEQRDRETMRSLEGWNAFEVWYRLIKAARAERKSEWPVR
jgi:hypothetical protein